ncbi:hypothetical protein [Kribbella catacumbae]|uniref:hypothetical protein n=1 Tax=Kribbella catacumbae TaxID=460086 RepID=UPI0003A0406F|nr:hypothetical protein [Kribbella catacumbae]
MGGLIGGLLAGPLYLVLVLAIQLLPRTARMLPPGNAVDLATWPIVAFVLAAAAAAVGGLFGRGVVSDPRDKPVKAQKPTRATLVVVGALGVWLLCRLVDRQGVSFFTVSALPALSAIVICLALPTAVLAWQGRRLTRSGNPLKVLAGGRLLRTIRPLGRMLGLLAFCGLTLGYMAGTLAEQLSREDYSRHTTGFQLAGFAFAAGAAMFIALIAGVGLLAGTADDLLDQRRQLTALNVLGVGEAELRTSVRYQLTSCITPAVTAGLAIGVVLNYDLASVQLFYGGDKSSAALMVAAAIAGGALLTWLAANAAAYLLRGQVHEAVAAENLRST